MKRIAIMLTVLALASSSKAASLEWGFTMDSMLYVSEDGASATLANSYEGDTTGWKFCLVYLGTSSTLDVGNVTDAVVVDSFGYGVYDDGDAAYPDPYVQTFATTGSATALDGSTVTITAGDYFGVVFYNGSEYSNIFSVSGDSVGEAFTETSALPSLGATANTVYHYVGNGANIAVSAVSAVPEPSVALMGLLGIGMLIKRRRA